MTFDERLPASRHVGHLRRAVFFEELGHCGFAFQKHVVDNILTINEILSFTARNIYHSQIYYLSLSQSLSDHETI